ncbi:MAG: hypothetical protein AAFX02_08395 [Pseudomonadota bacterium]
MFKQFLTLFGWLLLISFGPLAFAQTVGGVFGPNIKDGDKTAEYRLAIAPVDGSDDAIFVHRVHYQQAFNESWRARGVVQLADNQTGGHDFNFFQAELQWEFLEENNWGLSSALRLDGRVTDEDDGADLISFNSTTQWNIDENWRATAVILVARELGNNARDGINLETRASLTRKLGDRYRLGLESFNVIGNSDGGFAPANQQRHSLGPVSTASLGQGWSILGGVLFGVSDGAADTDFRLWVTKSF